LRLAYAQLQHAHAPQHDASQQQALVQQQQQQQQQPVSIPEGDSCSNDQDDQLISPHMSPDPGPSPSPSSLAVYPMRPIGYLQSCFSQRQVETDHMGRGFCRSESGLVTS
jgi:hypothetical protein